MKRETGNVYLAALIVSWIASRCFYFFYLGVRFDSEPLGRYLQYIDPVLLKTALGQSLFYLKDQPPGFNLFLGVMLKSFGNHVHWAFQAVYCGFGLGLAIVLFLLLLRLSIAPAFAFLASALFCLSPISILYENWLFYTYPLTFLLALSALFLHRYVLSERTLDGAVFLFTMAVIVLTRGIFHLAWLVLVLLGLWSLRQRSRRQLVLAGALPLLLVASLYCKNYLVFGTALSGEVYQQTNIAMMVFGNVSGHDKEKLIAAGTVTELAGISPYGWPGPRDYRRLLPPIKHWGIPVLDREFKSTGAANWNSEVIAGFAQVYYRDALAAARQHPTAYIQAVVKNLRHYFQPADETWPFPNANAMKVGTLLRGWHVLFAGQLPFAGRVPWLNVIAFPMCFLFGCRSVGKWLGRDGMPAGSATARGEDANAAVMLFMLYNIAYIAAVTILFSEQDHCRYRFKVSPFYVALFSVLVASRVRRFLPGWRQASGQTITEARPS